ncbi:MAG: SMC-Scp complex subunit ScpB, partial [Candidatus Colwellbacteria bacterium RBG_13_48_8]
LLFVHGEPIKVSKLSSLLKVDENKVEESLNILKEKLASSDDRGLALIIRDGEVQLTTASEVAHLVSRLIKEELDTKLTPASLEALSIIAYLGPCSRALIDYIRGVNSTFILRSLMVRGLIERSSDPKRRGSYLYQTTFDFLRHMGLGSAQELPEYDKYQGLVEAFLQSNDEANNSSN